MGNEWTIGRMLEWMQGYLEQHGDENPLVSARWLVSDVVGMSNMQLYVNLERPLDSAELDSLRDYVKRRASGEPLQYITGKAPFRHIELKVREGVLIPRPETEVLVSEVLSLLPQYRYNVSDAESCPDGEEILIADLCTGSGCIACSLAYEHPLVHVVATDISPTCVDLAKENVDELGLVERIEVLESDLGSAIEPDQMGKFDAVVSNPPYIPTAVLAKLPEEVVGNEPDLALNGGEDGLDVFRRIAEWSYDALKDNGFFAVELHETTLNQAADIAESFGFAKTRIVKDLANKPRILIARK